MTTSRERILKSLNFETPDRLPKDMGAMRSTGISAFAYPGLVEALGLPPRLPRVHDTYQMLALPDLDVLDALGCDAVTIFDDVTNAFEQDGKWHEYDFDGRLPALVVDPGAFRLREDGSILHSYGGGRDNLRMPPSAYVFEAVHGGQPLNLTDDLPMYDLDEYARGLEAKDLRDEEIAAAAAVCKRARKSSDRAIMIEHPVLAPPICIHIHGGLAVFPILCLTEPAYVAELHQIGLEYTLRNARRLLAEIGPYIDIILVAADDWGSQDRLMAPPRVYRDLFLPYRQRLNDEYHRLVPGVKTFLHSCGAIYDILDMIIESRFDIINPVQWWAGGRSFREWKDKCRGRIVLWGGGVNSQVTLPLGTVDDVAAEVAEVVDYLSADSGFVFCNNHNILAEIPPEKVIAMYRAAAESG